MEFVFVIIYTIVATLPLTVGTAMLRRSLYKELEKLQMNVEALSEQKEANNVFKIDLIKNLESKSREVSLRSIEQIDISSLLEEVWNNSKFIKWEKRNRFCQVVPNLLLAIGVLGTFIGLSLVLLTLSSSVNSATTVDELKTNLERALGSMGISFLSSLLAIACSIFLTIFNLIINTNLSKDKLFNSLENYLRNIYLPKNIPKEDAYLYTQFDRIIAPLNNLSERVEKSFDDLFNNFINTFTSSIHNAVNLSFGNKIIEINDLHISFHKDVRQEIQELIYQANQVYSRFGESSTLLFAGANRLMESTEKAANILDNSSSKFRDNIEVSSNILEQNIFDIKEVFDSLDNNTLSLQQITKESSQAIESSISRFQETVEISNETIKTSATIFKQISDQSIENSHEFSQQISLVSNEFSESISLLGNSIQSSDQTLLLLSNLGQELVTLTTGNITLHESIDQSLSLANENQQALSNTNTELQKEREIFQSVTTNLNILCGQIDDFTKINNKFIKEVFEQIQFRENTFNDSVEKNTALSIRSEELSRDNFNSLLEISKNLEKGTNIFESAADILQKDFSRAISELKKYSAEVSLSKDELHNLAEEVKRQIDTLQTIQNQFTELVNSLPKS
jgi:hypothetical protein